MLLGRVVGNVWGARQASRLQGRRLLVVQPLGRSGSDVNDRGGRVIAVDALGAGPGELVLVAHSSRVRDLTLGADVPSRGVVLAIVDDVGLNGRGVAP